MIVVGLGEPLAAEQVDCGGFVSWSTQVASHVQGVFTLERPIRPIHLPLPPHPTRQQHAPRNHP